MSKYCLIIHNENIEDAFQYPWFGKRKKNKFNTEKLWPSIQFGFDLCLIRRSKFNRWKRNEMGTFQSLSALPSLSKRCVRTVLIVWQLQITARGCNISCDLRSFYSMNLSWFTNRAQTFTFRMILFFHLNWENFTWTRYNIVLLMKIQMRIQILHFYHAKLWYELWRFEVANNKKLRQIKMVHYKTEQSKRFECAKQRTFWYDFQRWNLKPDGIFFKNWRESDSFYMNISKQYFSLLVPSVVPKIFSLSKPLFVQTNTFSNFFALFRRAPREKIYSSKANQIDKSQFLQTDFSKI